MRRKTKERLQLVGIILGIVIALGTIGGAIGGIVAKTNVLNQRNPDNLITLKSIEATGVKLGEAKKSSISDVTVEVSEKGVVKLTGTASADDTFVYANVTLKPGVYRFTGAKSSTAKTYEMFLVNGDKSYESDQEGVIVVNAEATYTVEIRIYEDCEFGTFGNRLYPTLWEVEDTDDKTVVKFWK